MGIGAHTRTGAAVEKVSASAAGVVTPIADDDC
jgi:hypothetical protein